MNFEKTDIIITLTLLLLLGLTGHYFYKELEKEKLRRTELLTKEKKSITDTEIIRDGKTIIWAGLSGEFPKFISSFKLGPKGYGWAEYPVAGIKKILTRDYNIRILERYMTPARLEFDFRNSKYPICHYPYIWKDPKVEFAKENHFLYSVGLDFGGDSPRKILFLKEKRNLFLKHIDSKGDIKILSLLNDTSIKGTFINDVDYGPVVSTIFEKNTTGDPVVKKKYSKHIKLMVASDNKQLLHMLSGNRFDYTFESLVTQKHYEKSGNDNDKAFKDLSKDSFATMTYDQNSIKSVNDPKLLTYSIRCTKHPLTLQLMPEINKIIRLIRSDKQKIAIENHRMKIEENSLQKGLNVTGILQNTFRQELATNKIDYWHDDYLKINKITNQKEEIFTKKKIQTDFGKSNVTPRNIPQMFFLKEDQNYILLSLADFECFNKEKYTYSDPFGIYNLVHSDIFLHTSNETLSIIQNNKLTSKMNSEWNFDKFHGQKEDFSIKKLTISAHLLDGEKIEKITSKFPNLEGLYILFPNKNFKYNWSKILDIPKLSELGIVRADLKNINLSQILQNKKLNYLDLSATILDKDQLANILNGQYKYIKTLKLSYQRKSIDLKLAQQLENTKLPSLEEIHLTNSSLSHNVATKIISSLSKKLKFFMAPGNIFDPYQIQNLFSSCANLEHFIIDNSSISTINTNNLNFPNTLETFFARNSKINDKILVKIEKINSLKRLDLTGNPVGPIFFKNTLLHKINEIYLGMNNITMNHIDINKPLGGNLKIASLPSLKINDKILNNLINNNPELELLDLSNNFISNEGLKKIAQLKNLKKLYIGNNLLSTDGIRFLLNSSNMKKITALGLNDIIGLDLEKIAPILPANLKELHLVNNYQSLNDMYHLFKLLPKEISVLNISGNALTKPLVYALNKYMPARLTRLSIDGPFEESTAYYDLINALPNSLLYFISNKGIIQDNKLNQHLSQNIIFPKELDYIGFNSFQWGSQSAIPVIKNLPIGLNRIWLIGQPLDEISLKFLSKHDQLADLNLALGNTPFEINKNVLNGTNFLQCIGATHMESVLSLLKNPSSLVTIVNDTIDWNKISNSKEFKTHFSIKNPTQVKFIHFSGIGFDDVAAQNYVTYGLSNVISFWVDNSSLTHKGIITFLKAISPDAHSVSFMSSSLETKGVMDVINHLPKKLKSLKITGSNIGEVGYQKFREWRDLQQKELGYEIELIE